MEGDANSSVSKFEDTVQEIPFSVLLQFFFNCGEKENAPFDIPVDTKRSVPNIFKMTCIIYYQLSFGLRNRFKYLVIV